MEIDIHRIGIECNDVQAALIGDCGEHRLQMLNKLRHIRSQNEQVAAVEQDFKAGDFNGDDAKRGILNIDLPTENLPAGKYRLEINVEKGNPIYTGDLTISDDDDTYLHHAAKSDSNALAAYRRKINRIGWILAAIGCGAVLAIGKIIFDLIS